MSLLRQLLISVSVALLAILTGSLALNLNAAHSYLSEQLMQESENAATSLALSLSQPANQEPVAQELLMSALFDTGHFQAVRLLAPNGAVQFERVQTAQGSDAQVPAWFAGLMPLPTAHAERAVSNGWSQLGTVQVQVDNRFAQQALWHSSLKIALLIAGAGLAWGLFVGALMRWFKRVLQEEITAQVQRIGTDSAVTVASSSQVRELSAVSSAIQHAHVRVQKAEQVQLQRIESLELETNCDPVTQLPNRKYFLNELNKQLHSGDQAYGHVLLLRLRDLQQLNNSYTRMEVDDWTRAVTQQVRHALQTRQVANAHIARLNGSDFAVLLPQMHSLAVTQEVQQLRKLLQSLSLSISTDQWSRWAFALTPYAHGDSVSDVLVRLDRGLMQAESAGHSEVEYVEPSSYAHTMAYAGEGQWQQVLTQALQTPGQLQLDVQSATSASLVGTQQRFEATLELHEADGHVLRASLFLPAASRLGLMDDYDLQAVQLGLQWLAQHPGQNLVVRIALVSLEQDAFLPRLRELLQAHSGSEGLSALLLELDAHALEAAPDNTQQLCTMVGEFGIGVGLRRLDQAPRALIELGALPLRYVKLGGYFAEQAQHNLGARYLVEAMLAAAVAQGAQVYITENVNASAADWLRVKGASLPVLTG